MYFVLALVTFGRGSIPLLVNIIRYRRSKRKRRSTSKPPQSEKLLRPPGYSLAERISERKDTLDDHILWSILGGGVGVCSIIEGLLLLVIPTGQIVAGMLAFFTGIAGLAVSLHFARKVRITREDIDKLHLGLRGEQAVGEMLTEAAEWGYRTYHDFVGAGPWNIDHVCVGERGVFLIESKARTKRTSTNPKLRDHEINVAGAALEFPTFTDTKSVNQALANARWLAKYLRDETGDTVFVEPLLVFPGWWVNLVSKERPVLVLTTKQLLPHLRKQPAKLDPKLVIRIRTALEKKCRTLDFWE